MVEVIKHGYIKTQQVREFTCDECGCYFKSDEYTPGYEKDNKICVLPDFFGGDADGMRTIRRKKLVFVSIVCPDCGRILSKYIENSEWENY